MELEVLRVKLVAVPSVRVLVGVSGVLVKMGTGVAVAVTVTVTHWGAYEALVFGQEHGDAGVDLADGEGDEHGAWGRVCVVL